MVLVTTSNSCWLKDYVFSNMNSVQCLLSPNLALSDRAKTIDGHIHLEFLCSLNAQVKSQYLQSFQLSKFGKSSAWYHSQHVILQKSNNNVIGEVF